MKDDRLFNYLICLREKVHFFSGLVKFGIIDSTNDYVKKMYDICILIESKLEKNLDNITDPLDWVNSINDLDEKFQYYYFCLYKNLSKGV